MKILISNDDGYRARGILALRNALEGLADLTVVAPDRNKSGASHSLTLDVPVHVAEVERGSFYVTGTPSDCVHVAMSGLFDVEFDMVVSGINDGENLVPLLVMSGGLVVTALWSIREHLIPRQLDLPRRSSSRTAAVTS